jgi:hypothetical protein
MRAATTSRGVLPRDDPTAADQASWFQIPARSMLDVVHVVSFGFLDA